MDETQEFETAFANADSANSSNTVETVNNVETVETQQPNEEVPQQTVTTETSNSNHEDPANEATETENDTPVEETPSKPNDYDRHKQNNLNAQRRIRQRESRLQQKDAEIERLRQRLAKYESKENPNELDSMRIDSLREEIEDANEAYQREAVAYNEERLQAFNDQVVQDVGYQAAQTAIPMIQRWADYVNQNERELVKLMHRPYGKHLLFEWCTRVESSPTALRQWQGMTDFEKSRKLTQLYEKVVEYHTPKQSQPQANKQPNVAVAQSGRGNTLAQPAASDDFGTALEKQMQRLGIKKL